MKLQLLFPVNPVSFNQKFGECHPSVCSKYKAMGFAGHNGIDFKAKHGQAVYAAHDGVVTFSGEDGSAGYGVVIRTTDKFEYGNKRSHFKTVYWHLKVGGIKVRAGQNVRKGDLIGLADNTGMSTGDHLHFGLKPVYPGEKSWEWWNAEQNNGYKGAIDPMPYFIVEPAPVPVDLSPGDKVAVLAAKEAAKGDWKLANILFSVAQLVRSFIK